MIQIVNYEMISFRPTATNETNTAKANHIPTAPHKVFIQMPVHTGKLLIFLVKQGYWTYFWGEIKKGHGN